MFNRIKEFFIDICQTRLIVLIAVFAFMFFILVNRLFQLQIVEGEKYLDGAISDPIPLQKALDDGYEKIIVVLTRPEGYQKHKERMPYKLFYKKYPNFIKTAMNQPEQYNKTLEIIKKYENEGRIFVLRPSKDLKIARVEKDLEKLAAIHKLGIDDCISNLEKIKNYLDLITTS